MATAAELLALVETALETRLSGGLVDEYTVHGVSVRRCPLTDLIKLRDRLRTESARRTHHGVQFADKRGYS